MNKSFTLLFIFFFNFITLQLILSQDINYEGDKSGLVFISPKLNIFEDTNSKMQVWDFENNKSIHFHREKNPIPAFSFTKSTIWCKFMVKFESKQPCYMEISPPILNEITLYQIFNNRIDSLKQGSFFTDKKNNQLESNNYIFKLDPNANYYLIKIKSKTRLFININLASFNTLIKKTTKFDAIHSMYAGLLLMIFIYNLFLYFSSRENIYLFYLLHLINASLYFLYISGYGMELIWENFPIINSYFISIMCFGFIFSLLFVIQFLETFKNLPILHYLLIGMGFILAITGIADISGYSIIAGKMMNYIGLPLTLMILIGAFNMAKKGFNPAYTFLYAWLLYMIGIIIQVMQSLNFIQTNYFTSNSIQIGSAIEIVLLSIAIGNKINFYKKKKVEATLNEKNLLQENELLINEQKDKLETRFQEMTEMLYIKNKELKKQNQEIKNQFDEITEQNKKMLEYLDLQKVTNTTVLKQKEELQNHVANLEQIINQRTAELKEATAKAEEANELKTAFLKDFSHEIRTPMNAIAGFSSLLMELEIEDKSHAYYVDIINTHTENLLDLIENIVDLSQIHTYQLKLKNVKFNPAKMYLSLLEKFTLKLKRERKSFIELKMELPKERNHLLYLDYNRFWKIVYQLIDNSIKYTENGYIQFGYKKNEKGNLEIFVKDTGIGIKKDKLDVVFDNFRKIETQSGKFHAGVGMGLSLVKGLVLLMNGKIEIDSHSSDEFEIQSGTLFTIEIPNPFIEDIEIDNKPNY